MTRVLLIGKRAAVLTSLQAALREVGIEADLTHDVGGADHSRLRPSAAVAFGRAVSDADRTRMKEAFRAVNPEVVYVDGLAPITPLLVAQFQEAIDPRPSRERKLATIGVADGSHLELRAPAAVQVIVCRLTRLYLTRTTRLLDEERSAGLHVIEVPRRLAHARQAFAVIRADADEVRIIALAS